MPQDMKAKIRRIHQHIWNESDEDNQLDFDTIEQTIMDLGGMHPQTRQTYWDTLKQMGIVAPVNNDETLFHVKQPEQNKLETGNFQEKERLQVTIPKQLKQQCNNIGCNFGTVITEALVNHISDTKNLVKNLLNEDVTETEAEYIMSLLKRDVYKKGTTPEDEAEKDRVRRTLYNETFGTRPDTEEATEHVEKLREMAFNAAKQLNIVNH